MGISFVAERAAHLEKELSTIKSRNEELSNSKKRTKELEVTLDPVVF